MGDVILVVPQDNSSEKGGVPVTKNGPPLFGTLDMICLLFSKEIMMLLSARGCGFDGQEVSIAHP
jgi:hypothetical protein